MPLGMCVATPELLQGEAALKGGEDEGRSQRHQCHRGWSWLGEHTGSGQRQPCAIRQSMLEGPNCTRALVWP